MSTDVMAKLRELYPDEPLLYSFRTYLDVIEAGGFAAARAALERHIEWKANLAPFHDEIDGLRAAVLLRDEYITELLAALVKAGGDAVKAGQGRPLDEVLAELGLDDTPTSAVAGGDDREVSRQASTRVAADPGLTPATAPNEGAS